MSSWEKAKQMAEKSSGGGLFLNLKDGEKFVGVLVGDPLLFWVDGNWPMNFKEEFSSSEEAERVCGKARFRFKTNFLVKEGDLWSAKILQGGSPLVEAIDVAINKYGDKGIVFEISQKGEKLDANYFCLFERNLTDDEKKIIEKVPLNELRLKGDNSAFSTNDPQPTQQKGETSRQSDDLPDYDPDEDLPF